MDAVKKHFQKEAHEFDQIILKVIPYYPQMLDSLVTSIPFTKSKKVKVIDLGCGTGTVAKKVKEKYPNASIHCVDIATNMLGMAKLKLANYPNITYENADLSNYSFIDSYDAILSSLTLHHLVTDSNKINFYTKIYQALKPKGIFYNADVILGSNNITQKNNMLHWIEFMQKTMSIREIKQKCLKRYKQEDHPTKLSAQLQWLNNIGFINIDVVWKYYNFAVYGGFKK